MEKKIPLEMILSACHEVDCCIIESQKNISRMFVAVTMAAMLTVLHVVLFLFLKSWLQTAFIYPAVFFVGMEIARCRHKASKLRDRLQQAYEDRNRAIQCALQEELFRVFERPYRDPIERVSVN